MASIADIEQISASIACEFNPRKIVLFGSHAWGTPAPDSDVDMLVILPSRVRDGEWQRQSGKKFHSESC
jgi:predicted nucleotidyltransferase